MEYNEYIEIKETTNKYKKQKYWKIAVGLNEVDNLTPSEKLKKLAYENINNKKTYIEVEKELYNYYGKLEKVNKIEYECDLVSLKIVKLLDNSNFSFTINNLKNIHKELFEGIINEKFCGEFRNFNIQKYEEILSGDSAIYGEYQTIEKDLIECINFLNKEKYLINNVEDIVKICANCVKLIWDIHPFVEGNTRTSVVFTLKFLNSLGVKNISNDLFKEKAKYFRNCLVLANYSELNKYNEFIQPNIDPLYRFFEKLIINNEIDLLEIKQVHNNKYYQKIENPSKLIDYENLNEELDLEW